MRPSRTWGHSPHGRVWAPVPTPPPGPVQRRGGTILCTPVGAALAAARGWGQAPPLQHGVRPLSGPSPRVRREEEAAAEGVRFAACGERDSWAPTPLPRVGADALIGPYARVWAPAPTAQGAPHLRGPRANPAKRFAWGKGGPAVGMSVRARPEASDPKLGLTLSRCSGCATPHCLPLREKHLAPAAQLLFRLRGSLCGCSARLRASCHAAGWAHGRVAKRPFREKCRRASPGLFFRLHILLAPLYAYPPRF